MSTTLVKIGMTPPHPGAFIRDEILDELGLNVNSAAAILHVRRATLSDLVNGNAALSPEMALRIEKAFGVDMEMLLRMQAWSDTKAMRSRPAEIGVKRYQPAASPVARDSRLELVEHIATQAELTPASAAAAYDAMLDGIVQALKKGEEVRLPGFGAFTAHKRGRTSKEVKITVSPKAAAAVRGKKRASRASAKPAPNRARKALA
jgi:addiction module HigA family antidote